MGLILPDPAFAPLRWGLGVLSGDLMGVEGIGCSHVPASLQQRGERDSQTQAILTKLKCAAGEARAAGGGLPGLTHPASTWGPTHTVTNF